jgi:hypothetical protein
MTAQHSDLMTAKPSDAKPKSAIRNPKSAIRNPQLKSA